MWHLWLRFLPPRCTFTHVHLPVVEVPAAQVHVRGEHLEDGLLFQVDRHVLG